MLDLTGMAVGDPPHIDSVMDQGQGLRTAQQIGEGRNLGRGDRPQQVTWLFSQF